MTRSLGSWLSAFRRQPLDVAARQPRRGWQPLPDDIAEWMGAKPYGDQLGSRPMNPSIRA